MTGLVLFWGRRSCQRLNTEGSAMAIDKRISTKLSRFTEVFNKAREDQANESDTVMFLIKFFEEVLGYDPLGGEITKEVAIKDRRCDFSVVVNTKVQFLVEAKSAGIKVLNAKHIEQAENYASRLPINWVLLTNGLSWYPCQQRPSP